MRNLRAFFKYFGAKHRAVAKYPAPVYENIIEPFAGSAAFATRYADRRVTLVDLDPSVVATWRYLIDASSAQISSLPVFRDGETHIDDLGTLSPGAKSLIGFWLFTGSSFPRQTRSSWALDPRYHDRFWGESIRERIASQVAHIKHWRILHGGYNTVPNTPATWFIDPPYQIAGRVYKHGADDIDFRDLAQWARSRLGQVIVCENVGAAWLPFRTFYDGTANRAKSDGISKEAIFVMSNGVDVTDLILQDIEAQQTLAEMTKAQSEVVAHSTALRAAERRVIELALNLSVVSDRVTKTKTPNDSETTSDELDEQSNQVLERLQLEPASRRSLSAELGFNVGPALVNLQKMGLVSKDESGNAWALWRIATDKGG